MIGLIIDFEFNLLIEKVFLIYYVEWVEYDLEDVVCGWLLIFFEEVMECKEGEVIFIY